MDFDRLLFLFREYLFMDSECASEEYVDEELMFCGATEDEIKFLKGEI